MTIPDNLGHPLRLIALAFPLLQLLGCSNYRDAGDNVEHTSAYLTAAPNGPSARQRIVNGSSIRRATDAEVQAFQLKLNKGVPPKQLTQAEIDARLTDIAAADGDHRRVLAMQFRKAINGMPTAEARRNAGVQLRAALGPATP